VDLERFVDGSVKGGLATLVNSTFKTLTINASTDEVAHFFALGSEVALVGWFAGNLGGDAFYNPDARELERFYFLGVVGDEADGRDVERLEYLGGELEVAAVGLVAEFKVGFDGVEALVLKFVGAELGHEADAPAFLLLVEKNACARVGDEGHGELKLLAAVASQRVEDVAGEALRMNAHDGGRRMNVTHDESYGGFYADSGSGDVVVAGRGVVDAAFKAEDTEVSPASREVGVGYFGHAGERHELIIRFVLHGDWIVARAASMQLCRNKPVPCCG